VVKNIRLLWSRFLSSVIRFINIQIIRLVKFQVITTQLQLLKKDATPGLYFAKLASYVDYSRGVNPSVALVVGCITGKDAGDTYNF